MTEEATTTPRPARVGDVIEHGQDIPANVRAMRDNDDDLWRRTGPEEWTWPAEDGEPTGTDHLNDRPLWWPMTVVEVDPEPQPAEDREVMQLIEERDDAHEWADRLAQAIAEHLGVDIGEHSNFNLPWQAALIALGERAVATDTESGPLVLTLPEVPAEAVALIGGTTGTRYERFDVHEKMGGGVGYRDPREEATWMRLFALYRDEEYLTVEFAPPREPRTWPKIDAAPDDLKAVRVGGDRGEVYRLCASGQHEGRWLNSHGAPYDWGQLREVDLTEVLDA